MRKAYIILTSWRFFFHWLYFKNAHKDVYKRQMINNVRMLFDAYSTPISRPEFEYLSSPEGHIMMALREKCGWKWSVMSIILKIFRRIS